MSKPEEMSLQEALLLASLVKESRSPHLRALKIIGYHYSLAAKELLRQEKVIRRLEGKLRWGR